MHDRRKGLGGYVPTRVVRAAPLALPDEKTYASVKKGSGQQSIATTMAFVRLLKDLMRDKELGKRFVLIAPDEYRTFGMDSFFRVRRSTTRSVSSTRPWTAICCWPTRSRRRARCCTTASRRPAARRR